MSVVGVVAGGLGQSDDGIAMDADEAFGLTDAVALGEVMEHRAGLLVGESAIEQRRALALGEAGLAGVAVEQADLIPLAVAVADGEVAGPSSAVEGAVAILATEAGEIVHRGRKSLHERWVKVQSLLQEMLDILRLPIVFCSVRQCRSCIQ
jgi:hypothetical protein